QTRAVNDPTGAKTMLNSMGDLVSPEATRLFIEWTHEQYKKHLGDLIGTTVIAFRGDEPEMTGVPWSPGLRDEFMKRKGYDVTDYMASFVAAGRGGRGGRGATTNEAPAAFSPRPTDAQIRAKAD